MYKPSVNMEPFLEAYEESEAEKAELELYGLKNDYEDERYDDSDDERAAVEEAMFMKIHYAAAVDENEGRKDESDSNILGKDDTSVESNESPNNNKTNFSLLHENSHHNINVEKIRRIDENVANDKLNLERRTVESQKLIVGLNQPNVTRVDKGDVEKQCAPNLNDSVIILDNESDEKSDSKYMLEKPSTSSKSKKAELASISKDGNNIPKNVRTVTNEGVTTILSSDSGDDICFISSKSPQKEMVQSSSSSGKPATVTGGRKINRTSFIDTRQKLAVQGEQGKQRTWRGGGASKSSSILGRRVATVEITSETISKSLKESQNEFAKERNSIERVAGGSRDGGEESDSDCMLIESMSEDEDMDFNFVAPLGMGRSEQGPVDEGVPKTVDGSATECETVEGSAREPEGVPAARPPSRYFQATTPAKKGGPKCMNCYEFGHLARACPEPKRIPVCFLCGERGHFDKVCPDAICFNCNLPGHRAATCDSPKPARFLKCGYCQARGHNVKMCPDLWRRFHLTMEPGDLIVPTPHERQKWLDTSNVYCCNCGKLGHHAYECEEERMNHFTFVAFPYVNCYKSKGEKRRERRINKKEKDEAKRTKKTPIKLKTTPQHADTPPVLMKDIQLKLTTIKYKLTNGKRLTKKERTLCHANHGNLPPAVVKLSNRERVNMLVDRQKRREAKLTPEQKKARKQRRKERKRTKKQAKQQLKQKIQASMKKVAQQVVGTGGNKRKAKDEAKKTIKIILEKGFNLKELGK